MGSSSSNNQNQSFNEKDWELVQQTQNVKVWQNKRDRNFQVEQHSIFPSSEDQFKHEREMYYLRKNNPRLVSALHFEQEKQEQFCSSHYRGNLYLEKIPLRLSDLEHIPFPDALHLYDQCLHGFLELAKQQGCFSVDDDHIGINERGVAKVWLNAEFSKSHIYTGKISEQAMVQSIINGIQKNIDRSRMPLQNPSIRNFIYRKSDKIGFDEAIAEFNQYALLYNQSQIPNRFNCIDDAGGVYAIVHSIHHKEPSYELATHYQSLPNHISPQGYSNHVGYREQPELVYSNTIDSQFIRPVNVNASLLPPVLNINSQRTVQSPRFSSSNFIEGSSRPIENIATFKKVESSRSGVQPNFGSQIGNNSVFIQNGQHINHQIQNIPAISYPRPAVITESMISRNYLPINQPIIQHQVQLPPANVQKSVTIVRRADTLIANLQQSQTLNPAFKKKDSNLQGEVPFNQIQNHHQGYLGQKSKNTNSQPVFQVQPQQQRSQVVNFNSESNNSRRVEKVVSNLSKIQEYKPLPTEAYKQEAKIQNNKNWAESNAAVQNQKWKPTQVSEVDSYKNTTFTSHKYGNESKPFEVSANDGKSSQQFLRKLKEISLGKNVSEPSRNLSSYQYEYGSLNTEYSNKYNTQNKAREANPASYEFYPYNNDNVYGQSSYGNYGEHSSENQRKTTTEDYQRPVYQALNSVNQEYRQEEQSQQSEYRPSSNFQLQSYSSLGGQSTPQEYEIKNTTSNIIPSEHQYLAFQQKTHTNSRTGLALLDGHAVEMKYSMTQDSGQKSHEEIAAGGYQVEYDPDILADLQNLRQ